MFRAIWGVTCDRGEKLQLWRRASPWSRITFVARAWITCAAIGEEVDFIVAAVAGARGATIADTGEAARCAGRGTASRRAG
jgi:hypothetical protein